MSNVAKEGNLCSKCGSELRVSWCAQCFGTGKSGNGKCKTCGGKGTTIACPNFRSHKLHNLLKFGRILPKRLALF
jgi:predicted amidophosphoribosyltransferase